MARAYAELGQDLSRLLETMRQPTIAAVNGYALGGGCEMALACDLRFASTTARFGQPEINLGIIPGWGGTQRLARTTTLGFAKELILTGRMVDAEEALERGLVAAVLCRAELLAHALGSRKGSPPRARSPSPTRRRRRTARCMAISPPTWCTRPTCSRSFSTDDAREGLAFLHREAPPALRRQLSGAQPSMRAGSRQA